MFRQLRQLKYLPQSNAQREKNGNFDNASTQTLGAIMTSTLGVGGGYPNADIVREVAWI